MKTFSITVFSLALLVAGCAGAPAPAPEGGDATADAAACRQFAAERVSSLPAVRSGRTTYVQGGARPYYENCMKERGYSSYPAY